MNIKNLAIRDVCLILIAAWLTIALGRVTYEWIEIRYFHYKTSEDIQVGDHLGFTRWESQVDDCCAISTPYTIRLRTGGFAEYITVNCSSLVWELPVETKYVTKIEESELHVFGCKD